MTRGRKVKIFPVGEPERAEFGVLVLHFGNDKSVAVEFDSTPGFLSAAMAGGQIGHRTSNGRVTMLLVREELREPWIDIASGLQYEITA